MTISIDNVYVQTFENNVRHLAQQSDTQLRRYVTEVSTTGQKHNWEILGAGAATQKTSARTSTPVSDLPWTRRVSLAETWHAGEAVEPEDPVQMLVDPNSNVGRALAMAMRRGIDDIIIAAATGTALDGDGTANSFPAGQVIGDGTGVMSLDIALQVQELFESNDVDMDEPKVFVIGPTIKRKLMQLMEVTSGDYQNVKALATGYLPNWMGFTWIVSNRLLSAGAGKISCIAFTRKGIGLQVNKDIWARVAEDPSISFAWRVYTAMTMGSVRVEDEHVVHINLKDAIS
jgi:hypothetical protein